jgi:hypothetical protein
MLEGHDSGEDRGQVGYCLTRPEIEGFPFTSLKPNRHCCFSTLSHGPIVMSSSLSPTSKHRRTP